ncbi:hypothetical protein ACFLR5_02230 [Elusimicrobiota bacterium]
MKKIILISTYVLLLVIVAAAFILDRRIWVIDSIILGIALTCVYLIYKRLNLTSFLFLLISLLVLSHCFAVFGLFKMTILGLEYDTYVHTYSSIIIALIAFNYVQKFRISLMESALLALIITLGIGLSNELIEFAGYSMFGRGEGLFLLGPGDIGSTNAFENLMTDFFSDFYGNLTGIFISLVYHSRFKR